MWRGDVVQCGTLCQKHKETSNRKLPQLPLLIPLPFFRLAILRNQDSGQNGRRVPASQVRWLVGGENLQESYFSLIKDVLRTVRDIKKWPESVSNPTWCTQCKDVEDQPLQWTSAMTPTSALPEKTPPGGSELFMTKCINIYVMTVVHRMTLK